MSVDEVNRCAPTIAITDKIRGRKPLARVDVLYFVANGALARDVAKAVRQPETV